MWRGKGVCRLPGSSEMQVRRPAHRRSLLYPGRNFNVQDLLVPCARNVHFFRTVNALQVPMATELRTR